MLAGDQARWVGRVPPNPTDHVQEERTFGHRDGHAENKNDVKTETDLRYSKPEATRRDETGPPKL